MSERSIKELAEEVSAYRVLWSAVFGVIGVMIWGAVVAKDIKDNADKVPDLERAMSKIAQNQALLTQEVREMKSAQQSQQAEIAKGLQSILDKLE